MMGGWTGWALALLAVTTAVVSLARLVSGGREGRFAAGIELLMAVGMVAMALPMTAAAFGEQSLWWASAFAVAALAGAGMAVRDARRRSWRHGRHWAHHVIGSGVMVLMALAAAPTPPAGPIAALGMPTMGGMGGTHGMDSMNMDGMAGMSGMGGMEGHAGMGGSPADSMSATGAASTWRMAFAALALYFLLSMAASLWARLRGTRRSVSAEATDWRDRWATRMLKALDVVVAYLISMAGSLRTLLPVHGHIEGARGHRRNPRLGASRDAALVAHLAMGGSMSAMLMMMA